MKREDEMNCAKCGWLGTVNDDGVCIACGFISDSGCLIPIIANERKDEDER